MKVLEDLNANGALHEERDLERGLSQLDDGLDNLIEDLS